MSGGATTELVLRGPVPRVWRALRDPAEIRRWHGWDAPGLDREVAMVYDEHAVQGDEPYTLVVDGEVTFRLAEHEDGTALRLQGVPREPAGARGTRYDEVTEGWISSVQQLRFALDRHPGEDRRTLRWSATGMPQANLADAESMPDGVLGRWFTSPLQDGLVVAGLGSGLLVLVRADEAHGGPTCSATLTTYGLDDDGFAAVRDRWTRWFARAYPHAAPPQD